jgi:hypothetical protein
LATNPRYLEKCSRRCGGRSSPRNRRSNPPNHASKRALRPVVEAEMPAIVEGGRGILALVVERELGTQCVQTAEGSPPTKSLEMITRETQLETALRANANLRDRAEELIAAYVEPESDRPTIINDLIRLYDGPEQREAKRLAEALDEASENSR